MTTTQQVKAALAFFEKRGSKKNRDGMARGADACAFRRRAGSRDAGADGPLGARFRQLGRLRSRACFHLFDRTPHAYRQAAAWAKRKEEFVKRAAFALIASLALHDKKGPDAPFEKFLPIIERAAADERNFVKKGVSWALRGIGHRNPKMRAKALAVARRLAASGDATKRWVGKDAIKDLSRPAAARS